MAGAAGAAGRLLSARCRAEVAAAAKGVEGWGALLARARGTPGVVDLGQGCELCPAALPDDGRED